MDWLIWAPLAGLAYGLFFYNSRGQRLKQAILKSTLPTTIANAEDGKVVKLVGTVAYASEPLEAPLSGRPCVYYHVRLANESVLLATEIRSCAEMWVVDESGRALVEIDGDNGTYSEEVTPGVCAKKDFRSYSSGFFARSNTRQRAFLRRCSHFTDAERFYDEGILEAGEEVVVVGLCKREPDPDALVGRDANYRQSAMRVRIIDPPGAHVMVYDNPRVVSLTRKIARSRSR
ncbi:MAG: hypothetical protein JRH20_25125 [Deltaproteobacteria bacterium]|nr:hypothetical protein [Deltaproteobacteria bacterium]